MRAKRLKSKRQQLSSKAPLVGPWRRRLAIRALAKDHSPEATQALAEFAALCHDGLPREAALDSLKQVTDPRCVDAVCEVWASHRKSPLDSLIVEMGWIASAPPTIRVLTALKANRTEMIHESGAEIVDGLVDACTDSDATIADRARQCLGQLKNSTAIDALCLRWTHKREKAVAEALERGKYVARQPVAARVLTALKAGRLDVVSNAGPEVVEALIASAKDLDPAIAEKAVVVLRQLALPETKEALCNLVIERDEPLAREAALAAQYLPRDPTRRALFYFLTEQWEKYEALDFDRQLLAGAYEVGRKKLRCRIAEKGRRSGRTEWLTAIVSSRHERRLSEMTGEEWEAAVAVLHEHQRWDECWQLAQAAPADWSARLLQHLKESDWRPQDERSRAAFLELVGLIDHCQSEPPFFGRLMREASLLSGHTEAVCCLAISKDNLTLASASHDHTVGLWHLEENRPKRILKGHQDWVDCLALSPDERLLASASRDRTVILRSWPEGEMLKQLQGHADEIRCLAFAPDGSVLGSASNDATIRLWSMPDGDALATLNGHTDIVNCLAVNPNGRVIASGSYDNDVRLWSLPGGQPIATLKGHKAMVNCVAFGTDGETAISGSKDRTAIIWKISDQTKSARLKGHRDDVSCLAISPDNNLLATGSWDTTIRLWKIPSGEFIDTFGATGTDEGHSSWVSCLAFSPDGKTLASGGFDRTVRLWSVPGGAPLKTLDSHTDRITSVLFSPDGRALISSSFDRTIRVWRSELARLRRLPIGQTTIEDLDWVENVLANSRLSDSERGWMQFLFALMHGRRRYDIQLGEGARISVGEFDIEIEG